MLEAVFPKIEANESTINLVGEIVFDHFQNVLMGVY